MPDKQKPLTRTGRDSKRSPAFLPRQDHVAAGPLDLHLLEEFRLAEEARTLFGELHWPIEPWIALQLARMETDNLRRELERLARLQRAGRAAHPGGLVADSLDRINLITGRRARELRDLIASSGVSLDPLRLELVLALLLRDGASTPLPGEIRLRAGEVDHYLTALTPAASSIEEVLPQGVDQDLLKDLRRVRAVFCALTTVRPKLELWEAFSLAVSNRAIAIEAKGLYGSLAEVRRSKALIARGLRRYVADLPIGHYSYDAMELAFALILASPEGCCRVRQWMESPEQFRREAAIRVEGVIGRAQKYLQILRATA